MKKINISKLIEGCIFALLGILVVIFTDNPILAIIYSIPIFIVYFLAKAYIKKKQKR